MKTVMLLSPGDVKGQASGISRWSMTIMGCINHKKNENVMVEHFCNENEVNTYASDGFFRRLINAYHNYVPLYRGYKLKIKTKGYDLVHICSSGSLGLIKDLLFMYEAHKYGTKVIIHFHFGRIPEVLTRNNWERYLLNKVIQVADKVIVMDNKSFISLNERGYKNVLLLPNPLSSSIICQIDSLSQVNRDSNTVLFAGHVVKTKGVFELIKACKELGNVKLRIVGDCDIKMENKLQSLIGEDSDRIKLLGHRSYEQTIDEMLRCGIFVLPTYTEGFPNVILESMACSCPIIATDVGAISEMLQFGSSNPCGKQIKVKEVNDIVRAIRELTSDMNEAKQMGLRARQRVVNEYSEERIVDKLIDIWENSID